MTTYTVLFVHRDKAFAKAFTVEATDMTSAILQADLELASEGYASAAFETAGAGLVLYEGDHTEWTFVGEADGGLLFRAHDGFQRVFRADELSALARHRGSELAVL